MIAIACDHAGVELKLHIAELLKTKGFIYKDFGTHTKESCDYADFAEAAARAVISGECDRGILICGTGVGISIAANKVRGIRCVCCSETFSAYNSRLHNNANMLALGARVIGFGVAEEIVGVWLNTEFEGGRHEKRIQKITDIENRSDKTE